MMRTRSIEAKREPFCWLEKRKLRTIADVSEEGKHGNLTAARSVYLALAEIASDKQSDTFTVATSYIAQRAGVTSKTVRRVIKILKRLGFVRIQGRSASGLKLAHEYTLIRGDRPIGPIYPSFGKARKIALPTREECDEESREGTARKEKEILPINDNDITIHARTGERFNRRTKEFVW
jgi:DNA binding protein with HTH domain